MTIDPKTITQTKNPEELLVKMEEVLKHLNETEKDIISYEMSVDDELIAWHSTKESLVTDVEQGIASLETAIQKL